MFSHQRRLKIEITFNSSQTELLRGLDAWLELGLISHEQVKKISQDFLTCSLPEIHIYTSSHVHKFASPKAQKIAAQTSPQTVKIPKTVRRNVIAEAWQGFKQELSLRWLLFLGLFLVIVSSGVLAASAWQEFPPIGQYGVLWTYTVVFAAIGFWANRQRSLPLTSQTLQTISLLLLPINFWAMDTFGLWQHGGGWLVMAIASITLTGIYWFHQRNQPRLALLFIALSHLHWGWAWLEFPLIPIYIAVIFSAIITYFLPTEQTRINQAWIIYALVVLLIRAIFVAATPLNQLGLAIGICGWLITKKGLSEKNTIVRNSLNISGQIILFLSWLVCFKDSFPIQATIITVLALQLYSFRLQRYWRRRDLLILFLIGLQGMFLLRKLVPESLGNTVMNIWLHLSQSNNYPYEISPVSIYSVTIFPYLIIWVGLIDWLYRQNKTKLLGLAQLLTLSLSISSTWTTLLNPLGLTLNLFLSTLCLGFLGYRQIPPRRFFIYSINIYSLLTIGAAIDWWFPQLPQSVWAGILLSLMIIEWSIPIFRVSRLLWRSCWDLGFVLAGISYVSLLDQFRMPISGLLWLATPLTLTTIANRTRGKLRLQAASCSCYTLVLFQFLTMWQLQPRLISFAFATGLMLVNTRYLRRISSVSLNLAFAIGFVVALFWGQLSINGWLLIGALIVICLWLLYSFLQNTEGTLASLYAVAADSWAMSLTFLGLTTLTYKYFLYIDPSWQSLLASILFLSTLIYRYWQQPTNRIIYIWAWGLEVLLIELTTVNNNVSFLLAFANILVGLLTLLLTRWSRLNSIKILPLIYGLLGFFWRLPHFTAYTGLLTLAIAFIGIQVGSRLRQGKILSYISLATISVAIYELVIYQMLQADGGSLADALTILAVVGGIIALTYRFLAYLGVTLPNLTVEEIKITAHIHWAWASTLKLLTATIPLESNPELTLVSITVSFLLAIYALVQGRDQENHSGDWWVYVGIVEIIATVIYARLIWEQLSILDPWQVMITSLVAIVIYQIPWRNWGWQPTPWRRTAIVIPAVMALVNSEDVSYLSLLIVGGVYGRLAIGQRNIRWSYVSLGFINWAILRWLSAHEFTDILWQASIIGLSFLYIAQVDPLLQTPEQRKNRHHLRLSGTGIISTVALIYHQDTGIIPASLGLIAIFAGLGLQIRAFLYVGTVTFILTVFYQLVVLSLSYSFLKWVIGLLAGIMLITIAANFEQRREQIIIVWQNWISELNHWQ